MIVERRQQILSNEEKNSGGGGTEFPMNITFSSARHMMSQFGKFPKRKGAKRHFDEKDRPWLLLMSMVLNDGAEREVEIY